MNLSELTALSPIDGRYSNKTSELSPIMSEFGLMKARLKIEIEWLILISKQPNISEVKQLNSKQQEFLRNIYHNFSLDDAKTIKEIEKTTNHDVKAIEYFIKNILSCKEEYTDYISFIHFACTSEDINNLSYGLMLEQARTEVITPLITSTLDRLATAGKKHASDGMLSRTHGQSATPTTMGKELINFADRVKNNLSTFTSCPITGKLNGAVGNYNAHTITYPNIDWPTVNKQFVENLGLQYNAYTTQINPHDDIAEFCHHLIRLNNIALDLVKDMWGYISLNYFDQKINPNEVGSSTMPHKVNPIDFENAEGNLGLANSLLEYFSNKLPVSRWQRDLSDSTVLRNLGVALGYCIIAFKSINKGLDKLVLNTTLLKTELNQHWELLAEPIQTVMRRYGIKEAYEQLKDLTRGEKLNQNLLHEFINNQALPKEEKARLLKLTPCDYTGYAEKLALEWQ